MKRATRQLLSTDHVSYHKLAICDKQPTPNPHISVSCSRPTFYWTGTTESRDAILFISVIPIPDNIISACHKTYQVNENKTKGQSQISLWNKDIISICPVSRYHVWMALKLRLWTVIWTGCNKLEVRRERDLLAGVTVRRLHGIDCCRSNC